MILTASDICGTQRIHRSSRGETADDPEFGDVEFGESGYDDSDSDAGDGADDDDQGSNPVQG
jgi:hypothetical protein